MLDERRCGDLKDVKKTHCRLFHCFHETRGGSGADYNKSLEDEDSRVTTTQEKKKTSFIRGKIYICCSSTLCPLHWLKIPLPWKLVNISDLEIKPADLATWQPSVDWLQCSKICPVSLRCPSLSSDFDPLSSRRHPSGSKQATESHPAFKDIDPQKNP